MNTKQFSLMVFDLARDIKRKTMTVQDTLSLAASAGVPSVDVMRVGAKSVPEYQAARAATGIKVCCYISCITFLAKEKAICSALDRDMAVARDLGAEFFMIVPYYMVIDNRKAKKMGREHVLEQMVRGFRLAVKKGKEYGLKVCFETTPTEDIYLSGTEDCRYVLEQVPELGLVFDTANMLPHGDETLAAYEALKSRIVHVHLKDVALERAKPSLIPGEYAADGRLMRRVLFGQGAIPVREVYERMLRDGYSGMFAIEYARPTEKACTNQEHQPQLMRHLRHLM